MSRRVVVTGLGVISALGLDVDTFWTNIINGKSGVSLVESFDTTEFQTKIAAEVKDFDPTNYLEKKMRAIWTVSPSLLLWLPSRH